jgi:hypothetical protein
MSLAPARDERDQPEFVAVAFETISPELALVDPELGARARSTLPDPVAAPIRAFTASPAPVAAEQESVAHAHDSRPYPLWARVTAALWLLVIGILIGGPAIPHAQDKPRLLPKQDEPPPTVCKAPATAPAPTGPSTRFGFP